MSSQRDLNGSMMNVAIDCRTACFCLTMRIQLGIFRNDSRSAEEAVQAMHSPPSTTSAWPVIKDERSEARNRIASAISSTLAKRRIGTLSEM